MKSILLSISVVFFALNSFGAIISVYVGDTADYTKPTADNVGNSDEVLLDITGDGTGYSIRSTAALGAPFNYPIQAKLKTVNNGIFESWNYLDFDGFLLQFNFGINISYSGAFGGSNPGSGNIVGEGLTTGFSPNTSYYIPITLENGNDEYFGWIKIKTLDNDFAVVVESYAWNDQPNGAIFAGQGEPSSELSEITTDYHVSIQNPSNKSLIINSSESNSLILNLYSNSGKLIKKSIIYSGHNQLNLNLKNGTYFAVLNDEQTIKVIVL